jgi:hypothetical protein
MRGLGDTDAPVAPLASAPNGHRQAPICKLPILGETAHQDLLPGMGREILDAKIRGPVVPEWEGCRC